MSVARAREFIHRVRAAGITVHELDGWESRGNGQSSAYEGWLNHHTATAFGMAPAVLWQGRSDLPGPLCNSAGNVDGSITMIAAHPANHAGASGGWDTAPLPRTTLFNKCVWGHEIVYPGTVAMNPAQYRTMLICSKIGVDIWGYGDVNRIKFHQGTSVTGKWDCGYSPGKTYDIYAARNGARTILQQPAPGGDMKDLILAKEASGKVWVGNGITRRHVQDEGELTGLKYWIAKKGGDPEVQGPWADLRVLGRDIGGTEDHTVALAYRLKAFLDVEETLGSGANIPEPLRNERVEASTRLIELRTMVSDVLDRLPPASQS